MNTIKKNRGCSLEEILRLVVKTDQASVLKKLEHIIKWKRSKQNDVNIIIHTKNTHKILRSYTVESDVKLTREEIQDMALSCSMVEGATYKSKNSIATFKGTEFGDDSQTEFGGDETKEEQSE